MGAVEEASEKQGSAEEVRGSPRSRTPSDSGKTKSPKDDGYDPDPVEFKRAYRPTKTSAHRGSFISSHAYASFHELSRRSSASSEIKKSAEQPKGPGKMIQSPKDFVLLIVLCLVEFHGFFSFSMIAPFYPDEAKKKGISESVCGFVFGIHPLVVFLLSPFIGAWLTRPGLTKPFILGGTVLIAVGNLLFAFVIHVNNRYGFLAVCFLARIIIAVGTSIANTASLAFLTEKFNAHLSAIFGLTELFVGLGFMSGPSIGSIIYTAGGFYVPFIMVSILNFVNLVFIWFVVPSKGRDTISSPRDNPIANGSSNEEKPRVTLKRSLKIPAVWVTCLTIHTIGFFLTFIQPNFTSHLRKIDPGITLQKVGLVFFLAPGVYAILAPILGLVIDKLFNPRNLIIVGHFGVGLAYFFMGPAPIFFSFLKPSIMLTSIAYAVVGIAQCPIMVPVIADLQMSIVNAGYPNNFDTSSIVSALFTSSINLGQLLGPIFGGLLGEKLSYPWAYTICALFVLIEGVGTMLFTMWERKTWNICCIPVASAADAESPSISYDASNDKTVVNGGTNNLSYAAEQE